MTSASKNKQALISHERLKEILDYDADTGIFTWKANLGRSYLAGKTAGHMSHGYIQIVIAKQSYMAHRLAWLYVTGEWPENFIDHINQVKNDNRFCNLREATKKGNGKNIPLGKANTSGVIGVHWNTQNQRWHATIGIDKKMKYLGCYKDKFEAICARKSANNKYGFSKSHGAVK